jgi:WD40 repeat protein
MTGKEDAVADGNLPCAIGNKLLAYSDTSGAYIISDAAGKTLETVRFNEQVVGPELCPDGKRILGTVYRPGPVVDIGGTKIAGSPVLSVCVFDLKGKEILFFAGYDDATWTPDGKIIATGKYNDPGLFELDPATQKVRTIDEKMGSAYSPAVSPDGRTLAVVTGDKVWLVGRDGKDLRQLFPHGMKQQRPTFSPDGTKVAFVMCNHFSMDSSGEVFVVEIKTKELTPLRTGAGESLMPEPSSRLNWVE